MKKLGIVIAGLLLVSAASGCMTAPVVPPMAFIYTGIQAPLDVDFHLTKIATKRGESSSMCILGMVAVGDASSRTAAENGNIAIITTADYSYTNILGIYQGYKTIVYGE